MHVESEKRPVSAPLREAVPPGWSVVRLGVAVPRSYFCICCLTFRGRGLHRDATTYCQDCWDMRQRGLPCQHARAPEERLAG